MLSNSLLLLVAFLSCSSALVTNDYIFCYIQTSPCTCLTRDGSHIDLTSLSVGQNPRFVYQLAGHFYQWDPCRTFDCGGIMASACRKENVFHAKAIGLQNYAKFLNDDKGMFLQYYGLNTWTRSKVYLKCDPEALEPQFSSLSTIHGREVVYEMSLRAQEVCPVNNRNNGGGATEEDQYYRNPGDILLVLFVLTILLHLILGAIFFITRRRRNNIIDAQMSMRPQ